METARSKRAVIYLRVSTLKQANRDSDPDGYSLPAQREACIRKAESLGAEVAEIFMDRGESAKTADRPEFQRMLRFVRTEGDIDYVILDKVDRFARNRRDDANTLFELHSAGAQLVSVKENIDETPAGQLLHAIMAGIAEFYSKNLATESTKGMTQKAKMGGTPGKAPVGYLNTRQRIDGREVAIVILDPDRAPLIQWAFEMYATGEWTIRSLTDALEAKGLTAVPQRSNFPKPLSPSIVARTLSHRYYIGKVIFKGEEYEGRHQPLISEELFARVQEVLRAHDQSGEKQRIHHHYLKGSVFCAACGSRLCITNAKGKYMYFFCLGRHQRRTNCTARYRPVAEVEAAVERYYTTVRIPEEVQDQIREGIRQELDRQSRRAAPEIDRARRRVAELAEERRRLARGVVSGSIPEDLAREEQERISGELKAARRVVATAETVYERIEETLIRSLALVGHSAEVYAEGGPQVRRMSNQFFFEKLLIDDEDEAVTVTGATLRDPYATLVAADFQRRMIQNVANPGHDLHGGGPGGPSVSVDLGRGSNMDYLVPRVGFEPTLSVV
ncbi:recombinase family protein [Frankia sp. AiPs1]|uniref:recombinase family protein n=1 Tax=Frankia sp. AiPs1 TaxID=573493 RepID=UPI0035ABFA00